MEKKKLLLVTISVGIFLVLTFLAAIVLFEKRSADSDMMASRPASESGTTITVAPPPSYQLPQPAAETGGFYQSAPVDPVDLVRSSGDVPGLQNAPEGTNRQGADFYVNSQGINTETVISVPKPSSAAVPVAAPAGKAAAAPKPAAAKPAAPAKAQPKPAAQTKVNNDYWVQTGAFSTVAKAEGIKDTLASRGITSIIENRDIDGRTLFRVRVGPYTSQNEANYWLSLIKSINGFEDSQIRQSQRL